MKYRMDDRAHDPFIEYIKQVYPNVDLVKMNDLNRMINWELWHGPLLDNYWTEVEPCDTPWPGLEQACDQLIEVMDELPEFFFFDSDSDCVTENDPNDDKDNFAPDIQLVYTPTMEQSTWKCQDCGATVECPEGDDVNEAHSDCPTPSLWIGGNWWKLNVRRVLLHDETYKQVF